MLKRRLPFLNRVMSSLVFMVAIAGLNGCGGGGGGSSTPTPNADPTGYYDVTGTASVKKTDNTTDLNITDLEALVKDNHILMFSGSNNLLYDITVTKIQGNNYTGTVNMYYQDAIQSNQLMSTATVNGTITQGSSITGTLSGSGYGNGTFNLVYAKSNTQVSNLSTIESTTVGKGWAAHLGTLGGIEVFAIDTNGGISNVNSQIASYFADCEMSAGTAAAINNSNMYSLSVTVTKCNNANMDGNYTGLATTQDSTGSVLPLAMVKTDGSQGVLGDFTR